MSGGVCVFGGSGGLGRAICRSLASEWSAVTFTYRSRREQAETLERELSARCRTAAIHADLRDDESVGSALRTTQERFGLDSVIFATGANILQPYVSEIAAQQWEEVVQVRDVQLPAGRRSVSRTQGRDRDVVPRRGA